MKSLTLAACILAALALPALAEPPPMPAASMVDEAKCDWEWKTGGGIGVWAERCVLATGTWELKFKPELPGFVLTVDGSEGEVVLQAFARPADGRIVAILPELKRRGYVPDDGDCVFQTAADIENPAPGVLAFFEIVPIGKRKADFDATPNDEVPEPPCPDYGWSTHGTRYFMTDTGFPERVVYVNIGQDGMMFDPKTVRFE